MSDPLNRRDSDRRIDDLLTRFDAQGAVLIELKLEMQRVAQNQENDKRVTDVYNQLVQSSFTRLDSEVTILRDELKETRAKHDGDIDEALRKHDVDIQEVRSLFVKAASSIMGTILTIIAGVVIYLLTRAR